MQEEANLDILLGVAELFTEHSRHEHQVVVVYPYHVVVLYILCDGLCEQAVGLGVCVPSRLVEGNLTRVVVEERPHDFVCNAVSNGNNMTVSGWSHSRSRCNAYPRVHRRA